MPSATTVGGGGGGGVARRNEIDALTISLSPCVEEEILRWRGNGRGGDERGGGVEGRG